VAAVLPEAEGMEVVKTEIKGWANEGTPDMAPMRFSVEVDPSLNPDDVLIDLTEFAQEIEEINIPRTLTPRIDEIELSRLRALTRKP
jgi:hypothetical protein